MPDDITTAGSAPRGRLAALAGVALIATAGLLLQMPLGAKAGITSVASVATPDATSGTSSGVIIGDDDRPVPSPSPSANRLLPSKSAGYQLRCWQYGRLLFDEGPVRIGNDARNGARLTAIDRNGATLIVTDTGTTTCLASPMAAAPNLGMPR